MQSCVVSDTHLGFCRSYVFTVSMVHSLVIYTVFQKTLPFLLLRIRPRNDLLWVEWDVKPYTLTHFCENVAVCVFTHHTCFLCWYCTL